MDPLTNIGQARRHDGGWRRVLRIHGRAWTPADSEAYRSGGCDGVSITLPRGRPRTASLSFVDDLPGLRYVAVRGPVTDDTAPLVHPSVTEVSLATGSRRPLPETTNPALADLRVQDRPGLVTISRLAELHLLAIWGWRGADLHWLGDKPYLRSIKLDGRKQPAALAGIEGCERLEALDTVDVGVTDLAPLRRLGSLRTVTLAAGGTDPSLVLDLADLIDLTRLESLALVDHGAVRSLRPLLALPSLVDVRLGDTAVVDGDLTPLLELPPHVRVGPIADRPHHTHTYAQITELRGAAGPHGSSR